MIWKSWSDFFHMGGYAFYVWGSFGLTAVLVAGEIVLLRLHGRRALIQARRAVRFGNMRDEDNENPA